MTEFKATTSLLSVNNHALETDRQTAPYLSIRPDIRQTKDIS